MHNVSAHPLPRYYQPQSVPAMAWTVSLTKDEKFIKTNKLLNTLEKLLIYLKKYLFEIVKNVFQLNLDL